MNKVILLFLLILFTNCFSYRRAHRDFDSFKKGDRVKLILNDRNRKGRIVRFENDTLVLERQNKKLEKFSSTEILEIKKGKFSWLKSVVAPTASLGLITYGALVLAPLDLDFNWGDGEGQ